MPRIFFIFILLSLCGFGEPSPVRLTPTVLATRKAMGWVVNIGTERVYGVRDPYIERLNEFYSVYKYRIKRVSEYMALGSGVVLDREGLVLTNWHVVRAAQKLVMRLPGGVQCGAHIVGFDIQADLCLVQLEGDFHPAELKEASFAEAEDLLLGEQVITLGNPLGLENSVSQGVLSAINRNLNLDNSSYNDLLQTDAAINPGNSGGPLVNMDGNLIGINQAVRSDAENIGYAIPVKRIELFLREWLLPERFCSARLGFQYGAEGVAVKITSVSPEFAKELKAGDRIVSVNGQSVKGVLDFGRFVWKLKTGEKLVLGLAGGRQVDVKIQEMSGDQIVRQRLGFRVQKLTRSLNEALGLPEDAKGLALSEVQPESEYGNENENWIRRFRRGDLILKLDGKELDTPARLEQALKARHSGECVVLLTAHQTAQQRYVLSQEEVFLK